MKWDFAPDSETTDLRPYVIAGLEYLKSGLLTRYKIWLESGQNAIRDHLCSRGDSGLAPIAGSGEKKIQR